jgi:lipid II:glycine glycyltransferase (peptidoglycan interpeptide bridge formation enzyme)
MLTSYFVNFGLKEPQSTIDTYLIDSISTKNHDEIFVSFRKTLRHSIKKSEDQKIEINKCRNEAELVDFYNLYLKTSKKNKTIPYPFSFFKYFFNSERSTILLAKKDKRIIAGSVFVHYEGYVHYYLNASDHRYRDMKANYLILWTKIKSSLLDKYKVFDLGGTGRGSSLEVFKTGWGGKRYPIFELKNYSGIKLKQAKLRNLITFVPSFLLKKLGFYFMKYKL